MQHFPDIQLDHDWPSANLIDNRNLNSTPPNRLRKSGGYWNARDPFFKNSKTSTKFNYICRDLMLKLLIRSTVFMQNLRKFLIKICRLFLILKVKRKVWRAQANIRSSPQAPTLRFRQRLDSVGAERRLYNRAKEFKAQSISKENVGISQHIAPMVKRVCCQSRIARVSSNLANRLANDCVTCLAGIGGSSYPSISKFKIQAILARAISAYSLYKVSHISFLHLFPFKYCILKSLSFEPATLLD
jgi:hypothetical protein